MAPSKQLNDVIGSVGGAVLAACLAPQLWRLYKTRSARDISYLYLAFYTSGITLSFIYLYYEAATVAWICALVELGFVVLVACAKTYLDHWGPYSKRALSKSSSSLELQHSSKQASDGIASSFPSGLPHDHSGTCHSSVSLGDGSTAELGHGVVGGIAEAAALVDMPLPGNGCPQGRSVRQRGVQSEGELL